VRHAQTKIKRENKKYDERDVPDVEDTNKEQVGRTKKGIQINVYNV
jgi:hypothetical protein